ncbi:MAG TPA: TonB family protein [Gammaproteobacteria bacterium]|nr:TonB family protein [Gammaproteobacteria bacterium]
MSTESSSKSASRQGDLMLWVAGGVIATVGVAWLVILRPWASGETQQVSTTPAPTITVATAGLAPPAEEPAASGQIDNGLDNPLRMAKLAYDAGMLVEPAEYSAWTLYTKVLKSEPNNAEAIEGITKVADDLVRRGETALDQGRFDDARATIERVRAVLPQHPGAKALAEKIFPVATATAKIQPEFKPELPVPPPPKIVQVEAAPQPPPKPVVDPVVEASAAFEKAMAASRLLTPTDQSAKHFVDVLVAANPNHEATRHAQQRLTSEFLSRATQSLEALDSEAARIWIDEAEAVGADPNGVRAARNNLTEQLIAMESAKPMPASALKITTYVAPEYPARALERHIEGWVDVEFTVAVDGSTHDIKVADASHDNYFRREAVAAVEKWRFEPRVFMNRPIPQRSYTRMRFVQ